MFYNRRIDIKKRIQIFTAFLAILITGCNSRDGLPASQIQNSQTYNSESSTDKSVLTAQTTQKSQSRPKQNKQLADNFTSEAVSDESASEYYLLTIPLEFKECDNNGIKGHSNIYSYRITDDIRDKEKPRRLLIFLQLIV